MDKREFKFERYQTGPWICDATYGGSKLLLCSQLLPDWFKLPCGTTRIYIHLTADRVPDSYKIDVGGFNHRCRMLTTKREWVTEVLYMATKGALQAFIAQLSTQNYCFVSIQYEE